MAINLAKAQSQPFCFYHPPSPGSHPRGLRDYSQRHSLRYPSGGRFLAGRGISQEKLGVKQTGMTDERRGIKGFNYARNFPAENLFQTEENSNERNVFINVLFRAHMIHSGLLTFFNGVPSIATCFSSNHLKKIN